MISGFGIGPMELLVAAVAVILFFGSKFPGIGDRP